MGLKRSAPSVQITAELRAAVKALAPAVARLKKSFKDFDPAKLPIGALADLMYELRQVKAQPSSLAAPFDDILTPVAKAVEEHFVQSLAVGESSGVQGQLGRVQVSESPVPVVKPDDWIKFWAYVAKTKQWDLLPRQISKEAVRERWDAKKQVKYVGVFHAKKVSCTKLSGKGGGRG